MGASTSGLHRCCETGVALATADRLGGSLGVVGTIGDGDVVFAAHAPEPEVFLGRSESIIVPLPERVFEVEGDRELEVCRDVVTTREILDPALATCLGFRRSSAAGSRSHPGSAGDICEASFIASPGDREGAPALAAAAAPPTAADAEYVGVGGGGDGAAAMEDEVPDLRSALNRYRADCCLEPDEGIRIRDLADYIARLPPSSRDRAILAGAGIAGLEALQSAADSNPQALQARMREICEEHELHDRQLTRQEATQMVVQLIARFGGAVCQVSPELVEELLDSHPTVADDGKLDWFSAVGHLLHRKATPVELVLYDLSQGALWLLSPLLLGRQFEAIYHSSVLTHGSEFWYGGCIFENEPPIDKALFGEPLFTSTSEMLEPSEYNPNLRAIRLGTTLVQEAELRAFLRQDLKVKYRQEAYDVLENNCNHFSDELVHFLTGGSIPDSIRKLPELVLDAPTARALRPFLNRWLRNLRCSAPGECSSEESAATGSTEKSDTIGCGLSSEDDLDEGPSVMVKSPRGRYAEVDLGFFDPTAGGSYRRRGARRECIKREASGRLVQVKSGHAVPGFSCSADRDRDRYRSGFERDPAKRLTVRRLVDGQIVNAKEI